MGGASPRMSMTTQMLVRNSNNRNVPAMIYMVWSAANESWAESRHLGCCVQDLRRTEAAMTGRIPARAARFAVALLASTAFMAVAAGTASAETTVKVPFEAEYTFTELTGGGFGSVHCVGTRQTNTGYESKGWATGTRDVEKCKSTEPNHKLIALTGGEEGGWFPGANGWNSDYDSAAAVSAHYVVSAKDRSFKLVAYY